VKASQPVKGQGEYREAYYVGIDEGGIVDAGGNVIDYS
jgi:hypothetical protein